MAAVSNRENAPSVSSLATKNLYRSPSTQSVLPSLGATCVAPSLSLRFKYGDRGSGR
jgi:hypothetical protein